GAREYLPGSIAKPHSTRYCFVMRSTIVARVALLLAALLPARSSAWGPGGHHIVALIAEKYSSATARQHLDDILKDENPCEHDLGSHDKPLCAATWADWS